MLNTTFLAWGEAVMRLMRSTMLSPLSPSRLVLQACAGVVSVCAGVVDTG